MPSFDETPLTKKQLLENLPDEWPHDPGPAIQNRLQANARKLVVLDDDPTGTQTVRDLWVLTEWTVPALIAALEDDQPAFYILTNSRALPVDQAIALNREIAANLVEAADRSGRSFDLVSRSDSTLRGHFPAETDALKSVLETQSSQHFDGLVLCPFFFEGGRLTAFDIHWVDEGEHLTPAGLTEFAQDATFGYRRSNLRHWVQEKTQGAITADQVQSISLETLRTQGPSGVQEALAACSGSQVIAVNALTYRDLGVFVEGLLAAQAQGQRFLFRTAASFVKVRCGLDDFDPHLPTPVEDGHGGLIAVGSYVQKSTRQLEFALQELELEGIELNVEDVLDPTRRQAAIAQTTDRIQCALASGTDALVYTSRQLQTARGRAGDLGIGQQVSSALVAAIGRLSTRPRFLIAKGGITSSDIATQALGVKRAWVLGPLLPGVPIWQLQEESRFPGLPYVVFPGNVGDDEALAAAIRRLRP